MIDGVTDSDMEIVILSDFRLQMTNKEKTTNEDLIDSQY